MRIKSLRKIHHNLGDFFVGRHARIGLVIFDQLIQNDLAEIWVRFYSVKKGDWVCFLKEKVRPELIIETIDDAEFNDATLSWSRFKPKITSLIQRKAKCHSCASLLTFSSSSLCLKCSWLKCNACFSCGCNYTRVVTSFVP